mmetsp:Transcript_16108/g.32851  ORF Transcript_16108/g.32851 Transcript_16108/m.32851 type:complete len:282 (-) Transcript_16108:35-880(-)
MPQTTSTPLGYQGALSAGVVGAVGAIPGTVLSFPLDAIKIRQQTKAVPFFAAARSISSGVGFSSGLGHAVTQKVVTRFPMFLVSAVAVDKAEVYMSADRAAYAGSAASGYVTGSLASAAEWNKVQKSVGAKSSRSGGGGVVQRSLRAHGLVVGAQHAWKRAHFCGLRNGLFDSVFFGSKRALSSRGCSDSVSYGLAASFAVVADYAFDVVTKRLLALPPEDPLGRSGILRAAYRVVSEEGLGVFRGLGAKTGEFAVSYAVTGACAATVIKACDGIFLKQED